MARAPLPPMGWNSWNQTQDRVTEDVVRHAAHALVDRGLAACGYDTVVIDDGWQAPAREGDGTLTANPERFPRGMAALAAEVRDLGLHFGIYSAPGTTTCAGYLGSLGHEQTDAQTFAEWGVDFVKYDWCGAAKGSRDSEVEMFTRMRRALDATGREIVLSISEYGVEQPWEWADGIAEMYRTTFDIWPTWSSVYSLLNQQLPLLVHSRPGCWADPDMLQVGNGDLNRDENRSHMALWCLMPAPLFIGTDLDRAPDEVLDLLRHPGLLALARDPLAAPMRITGVNGELMIFRRPLSDGAWAVAMLNHTSHRVEHELPLASLGFDGRTPTSAVDVWTGEAWRGGRVSLPAHATAVFTARD